MSMQSFFRGPRWPLAVATLLSTVLAAPLAGADMLVQSLAGEPGQYRLERGEQVLPLRPLTVLKPGDHLLVSGDGVLSLVGDDGKVGEIRAGNSPFVVPSAQSRGWLDNAMVAALDWYQGVADDKVQTVSLVTRGQGDGKLQLLGMMLDENLLPEGSGELRFSWSGGEAPYRVSLLTSQGDLVAATQVRERSFRYAGAALPQGDYLVRVEGLGGSRPQLDEQYFSVIDAIELPEQVRALQDRQFTGPMHDQLAAVLLARYPEWRFASLQLAQSAGDQRLSAALLSGAAPAGN